MKPVLTVRHGGFPDQTIFSDVWGELLDPDGRQITQHVSSCRAWLENDLLRGFGQTERLAEMYPDGFDVRWVAAGSSEDVALYGSKS